jgi:hypothetical protein
MTGSSIAWGAQDLIAVTKLALGVLGAVIAMAIKIAQVSYHLGRSDEDREQIRKRLARLEDRTKLQ